VTFDNIILSKTLRSAFFERKNKRRDFFFPKVCLTSILHKPKPITKKGEFKMKICKLSLLIVCMGLLLSGCTPDLVVTTLETTALPTVNADNSVEVPIRVVVKNQGNASADIFKVATEYTGGLIDPTRTFVVAFNVPSQSDFWYPYTSGSLAAGGTAIFEGNVIFNPSEHGVTVSLKATADSCSGDEFMPAYCRVEESNEGNNESAPISVPLP